MSDKPHQHVTTTQRTQSNTTHDNKTQTQAKANKANNATNKQGTNTPRQRHAKNNTNKTT